MVSEGNPTRQIGADRLPMAKHVRPLRHEELPALLALYEHLHADDEPPPSLAVAEAVWSEALANPRCSYVGGFAEGVLVSSCTVMVIPNLTRGCRPYALIENVVTHQDHRHQGWGQAVLKHALDWAWAGKCYKVMLMTGRLEASVFKFYEAAGFSRHGKQAFVVRAEG